jgi:hypothetical protein
MRTSFLSACMMLLATTLTHTSSNAQNTKKISCNLPSTATPAHLVGNWANGYNSSTNLVDAYSGAYVANAFQTGKYFHFDADGKYAEFYYLANAGTYSSSATRAIGTVEFLDDNSFIFHACKAHYKGWRNGALFLDRDATAEEVSGALTRKYYYTMVKSGGTTYMQIAFTPAATTGTSFRKVD